jgi:hypothetical protein
MNLAPTIRDIQEMLPQATWSIGTRKEAPRYLTLHFNGPAIANRTPKGELNQLIADAKYHMRPGALGAASGGDGLQYHYAVLSDGTIYQCRDDAAVLWHCAHKVGNAQSLAIHVPVGGQQDATDAQWASTTLLFDWLRTRYAIPIERVIGHCEWGTKPACPGPKLMPRLIRWRQSALATPIAACGTVTVATAVYEAPTTEAHVALGGKATLGVGAAIDVDAITVGKLTLGDVRWLHRADGLGFVPYAALTIALV